MLAPRTYMTHLRAYLNDDYVVGECDEAGGSLVLVEKYFEEGGVKPTDRKISLQAPEAAIAFKLDREQVGGGLKRGKPPLFHFLDDNSKAWSKRCDFIVFWAHRRTFTADCIEFKSKSLTADKIVPQLRAGANWCKSLRNVIDNYTGERRKIRVRKFVFGTNEAPGDYLDPNGQLHADPAVRYYHYDEVDGRSVLDLSNVSTQDI